MAQFYSYVPASELTPKHSVVTLLNSADTQAELLADPTYDPDLASCRKFSEVTDTGIRQSVTSTKNDAIVLAAVCAVN